MGRLAHCRQRGAALVFVSIALFSLLGVTALALDSGDLIQAKTRLQNAVDAASLNAAKVLEQGGSEAMITNALMTSLNKNLTNPYEPPLDITNATVVIEYSPIIPFFPMPFNADVEYVRLHIQNLPMDNILAQIFNLNKTISASAIAGPSPALGYTCGVTPVFLCQGSDTGIGVDPLVGYKKHEIKALSISSDSSLTLAENNLQLLSQNAGNSDTQIRKASAGEYQTCLTTGNNLTSFPVSDVLPVIQGLNTRFNLYSGIGLNKLEQPADLITDYPNPALVVDGNGDPILPGSPFYEYADYTADYECGSSCQAQVAACLYSPDSCTGGIQRRIISIPVVQCNGELNGPNTLSQVTNACFYILQPATQVAATGYIIGQFLDRCLSNGQASQSQAIEGPFKIQLFKDNLSGDS